MTFGALRCGGAEFFSRSFSKVGRPCQLLSSLLTPALEAQGNLHPWPCSQGEPRGARRLPGLSDSPPRSLWFGARQSWVRCPAPVTLGWENHSNALSLHVMETEMHPLDGPSRKGLMS